MRLDKFTVKAQEAIAEAQKKAEEMGHQALENEHLLYALLAEKEGTVRAILEKLGASPSGLAADIEGELGRLPVVQGAGSQVYMGQAPEEGPRHGNERGGAPERRVRQHGAPAYRDRRKRGRGRSEAFAPGGRHEGSDLRDP